jgi:pimeloyl-ACP methyl ester carboxylesterase
MQKLLQTLAALATLCQAQEPAAYRDPSPHKIQFVTVEADVQLEVLDWGGAGRPVVFLSGLGGTGHAFDNFAPKLTPGLHVYGITRRGFGASSNPTSGYDANRLGDDVVAVLESLKLHGAVLIGASFGGEEASSVGSRHPDQISGLIYLEGAYPYAFDNGKGMSLAELLDLLGSVPPPPSPDVADRASFATYRSWLERVTGAAVPEAEVRQTMISAPDGRVGDSRVSPGVMQMLIAGITKYTRIPAPVLAIFAVPPRLPAYVKDSKDAAVRAQGAEYLRRAALLTEKQAAAVETGLPRVRVVRVGDASHLVFESHEMLVLQEIRDYVGSLK